MEFNFLSGEINSNQKMDQEYYWYNTLGFSPITSETASGMELEYINSDSQTESPSSAQKQSKDSLATQNHSKDSLKFGRRVAKSFLQFIRQDKGIVVSTFLDCGAKILASQTALLGVEIIDSSKLMRDSLLLIEDVWNFFAKNLSCSYNKKISKVPKNIWDIVFTEEGFWKVAKEVGTTLQFKDYFFGCEEVEAEIIRAYYKKVLFLVNRGMIMVHLHLKKAAKEDFYENIAKFENYIMLSMVPELFDSYNHKKGVFVDECCRACKVCQSKSVDKTIKSKIKTAWDYAIAFEQNFKNGSTFEGFQDALNIFQFLTILDDAIASCSK